METDQAQPTEALTHLTDYLFNRRESLLTNWRLCCQNDPDLSVATNLGREEFNDRIPRLLNVLEQRLLGLPDGCDARQKAGEHGLHRWHKGYSLGAALAEITHLQTVVDDELSGYLTLYPDTPVQAAQQAHRAVVSLMNDLVRGSIEQYDELARAAAVERVANVQRALDELNELIRQRGDYLRTAAHDLRGNIGVISGAASLLELTEPELAAERDQIVQMVQRNAATARAMLTELMDLARLEAGQEQVNVGTFDAAQLLREVVATMQPLARERNLTLQGDGPASLPVQGDRVKVERIAQSLLSHALRHTPSGWVSVAWSQDGTHRWLLSVQDSNPDAPTGATAWLSEALRPTLDTLSVVQDAEPAPDLPGPPPADSSGEGVGLFAIKKLCELLRASLDVERRTRHDGVPVGTIYRVRFPINL